MSGVYYIILIQSTLIVFSCTQKVFQILWMCFRSFNNPGIHRKQKQLFSWKPTAFVYPLCLFYVSIWKISNFEIICFCHKQNNCFCLKQHKASNPAVFHWLILSTFCKNLVHSFAFYRFICYLYHFEQSRFCIWMPCKTSTIQCGISNSSSLGFSLINCWVIVLPVATHQLSQ